jgi:hypothetical protein
VASNDELKEELLELFTKMFADYKADREMWGDL